MIYATPADMVDRFGALELIQLTDTDNIPPSVLGTARITLKLADAQAFVEGYIGQVYALPLRGCAKPPTLPDGAIEYVPPPVLTRLACDIARYYLHDDLAPENEVYRRYKAGVKELDAVASGTSQLACPWGGSPGDLVGADAQAGEEVRYSFSPRVMSDCHLGDYR